MEYYYRYIVSMKIIFFLVSAQQRIPPISYPSLKFCAVAFPPQYQSAFCRIIPSKSQLNSFMETPVWPKHRALSQQVKYINI